MKTKHNGFCVIKKKLKLKSDEKQRKHLGPNPAQKIWTQKPCWRGKEASNKSSSTLKALNSKSTKSSFIQNNYLYDYSRYCQRNSGPGNNQLTPQPPWAY